MVEIKHGDRVKCLAGDIDRNRGKGATGHVDGFARFSSYHPREVYVVLDSGLTGWFWLRDVEHVDESAHNYEPTSDREYDWRNM